MFIFFSFEGLVEIVLRSGNSGADGPHTILRAQRIGYSLLSGGIVLPDSVSNESIFVPPRSEGHAHMPYAIGGLMHWCGFGIPIVEVPSQRHLLGFRRREGELNRTRFGAFAIQ